MLLLFLEKVLRRLVGKHFSIIRKTEEGVLRDGIFTEVNFRDHEVVDKKKFLIVEKGKYKIAPRESVSESLGRNNAFQAIIDNSQSSFDAFWHDDGVVSEYLGQARQQFYSDVLGACGEYLRGHVADIGCGPGFVLKALSTMKSIDALYGVDFSRSSIKRCREEFPGGIFLMGDIYHLACPDGVFDTVVCMETLEHLERAPEAICELFRICRKGGHVIITIPNGPRDEYVGHLNFWTEQDFRTMLVGRSVAKFQYFQGGMTMMFVVESGDAAGLMVLPCAPRSQGIASTPVSR
jgi:2-polyprenyl-3-methyl-5-hydroxy-6-metoxy-1,4-benzoquinol methylase